MNAAEARRRMREALTNGTLRYSRHTRERSQQRGVQVADIKEALLSAGLPDRSTTNPGEAWRFTGQTESAALCVVVGFDAADPTIITVWWVS